MSKRQNIAVAVVHHTKKSDVIKTILKEDATAKIDPEQNPVRFFVETVLDLEIIRGMDGVDDAIISCEQRPLFPQFVQIGGIKIPIRSVEGDTIRCNCESLLGIRAVIGKVGGEAGGCDRLKEQAHEGLWFSDLLALVDRSDTSNPFLTLSVIEVESHASRFTAVVREDAPEREKGGVLHFHVEQHLLPDHRDELERQGDEFDADQFNRGLTDREYDD